VKTRLNGYQKNSDTRPTLVCSNLKLFLVETFGSGLRSFKKFHALVPDLVFSLPLAGQLFPFLAVV
jgi:hypothetical protein